MTSIAAFSVNYDQIRQVFYAFYGCDIICYYLYVQEMTIRKAKAK